MRDALSRRIYVAEGGTAHAAPGYSEAAQGIRVADCFARGAIDEASHQQAMRLQCLLAIIAARPHVTKQLWLWNC